MSTLKFKVNMHCASCANAIDKKLKKSGFDAKSNPTLKITKVIIENASDEEKVVKIIKEVGYEAKRS